MFEVNSFSFRGQWVSTALNFTPFQPKEGDEIIIATPLMPEMTITFE